MKVMTRGKAARMGQHPAGMLFLFDPGNLPSRHAWVVGWEYLGESAHVLSEEMEGAMIFEANNGGMHSFQSWGHYAVAWGQKFSTVRRRLKRVVESAEIADAGKDDALFRLRSKQMHQGD